jgi:diaminohydroxyphosphoribosylaminopyrimidine deaminase/5-amino-6-(5-phosphoribosylamino)uracil reductase
MKKDRPYITLKIARSIDNKISKSKKERTLITGPESQSFVHRLRSVYDAVLVGANTINVDDPSLNVRNIEGRDPKRIVIDGSLNSSLESKVFNDENSKETMIFTSKFSDPSKKKLLAGKGVKIFELSTDNNRRLEISKILTILKDYKIISILVEGGCEIFSLFLKTNLFDELIILQAPILLGGGLEAARSDKSTRLELLDSGLLGKDFKTVYINKNSD